MKITLFTLALCCFVLISFAQDSTLRSASPEPTLPVCIAHIDPVYLADFDRTLVIGADVRIGKRWTAGLQGGPVLHSDHLSKLKTPGQRTTGYMLRPSVRFFAKIVPSGGGFYFMLQGLYKQVSMPLTETVGGQQYSYRFGRRIAGWALCPGFVVKFRNAPLIMDIYGGLGTRIKWIDAVGQLPPGGMTPNQFFDIRVGGRSVNMATGVRIGWAF